MNKEDELIGHLTEALQLLDQLADERMTETWLRLRIKEARESIGMIVGYLIG